MFLDVMRQGIERYRKGNSGLLASALIAVYTHPSFLGVLWYRIGHVLWLRRRNPIAFVFLVLNRALYPLVRMYSGLELSPRAQIGPGLFVGHFSPTVIHADTIAGQNLTILQGVTIGAHSTGVPHLGDNVSIGTGAIVVGGIVIGNNATIAAGAVVVKDVPEGCTVAGVPAKSVGLRPNESWAEAE